VQVAHRLNLQVNQTMACDLIQHVVKKTYACIQLCHASAIQIDVDSDLRFVGVARDFGAAVCAHAWHFNRTSWLDGRANFSKRHHPKATKHHFAGRQCGL